MLTGTLSKATYRTSSNLNRIEQQVGRSGRSTATARTATRYTDWCIAHHKTAFPPSYESVAGFVVDMVKDLRGSAKSVANVVSSLHVFGFHLGTPWLSRADSYKLRKVTKQLILEDPTPVRRKLPMVLSNIQQVIRKHWRCLESDLDLLRATMALTAHNGLLRGGELLGGIRVKDLTWEPRNRSVVLHLDATKTERTGAGVHVRITDHRGASAYKYLRMWVKRMHLADRPSAFLFPNVLRARSGSAVRFDFNQTASAKWFLGVTRGMAVQLGLDPKAYSNHSYRAGGATDLFIIGVPYPKIKKYGRWRSEAALVYYRDDIEVSGAIARAFGSKGGFDRLREYAGVGVRT